jgi:hypothetical protein
MVANIIWRGRKSEYGGASGPRQTINGFGVVSVTYYLA